MIELLALAIALTTYIVFTVINIRQRRLYEREIECLNDKLKQFDEALGREIDKTFAYQETLAMIRKVMEEN